MTARTDELIALDHAHVWHPFTPMRQWTDPRNALGPTLVIERAQGVHLIDTDGNRYIDGVSSLWCNVHGHHVPAIDDAIRRQLDKIAHSTLLGLAGEASIELAAELVRRARGLGAKGSRGQGEELSTFPHSTPRPLDPSISRFPHSAPSPLRKVFFSDAGATALEAAFKMAVGYWFHTGKPRKCRFIGLTGGYHGDTVGSMSVGYSDLFHRPFAPMVFPTYWAAAPDALRLNVAKPQAGLWACEDLDVQAAVVEKCLGEMEELLQRHADEVAAVVLEPVMQGAAGMICQPPGFVRSVADLARKYDVLLIADEVATGFGRTGAMFACEHEVGENFLGPDILCVAKGLTGGYLPLAATLATDRIYDAFCGEVAERKTLFHGHTYTGNALACAAALASLRLFDETHLLDHVRQSAVLLAKRLDALRDPRKFPHVVEVRQRGLMIGIELARDRETRTPFDPTKRVGAAVCRAMRDKGLIIRPLGDVVVLMPILATPHDTLDRLADIVIDTLAAWRG